METKLLPEKKFKKTLYFHRAKDYITDRQKNTKSVMAQMPTVGMAMAVGNRKEDAVCSH